MAKQLSAISLFTGAGGLDLGFEAAGFKTRVAVEMDPVAVTTLTHNRTWPIIPNDIHSPEAASEKILAAAGLRKGEADVLIGGPPCQPFSKSGYWANGDARRLADSRASTLSGYLRVLRDTLPKVFLIENVPGIAFTSKDEGLLFLEEEIVRLNREVGCNYSFRAAALRAANYGVPQHRERVFIVGQRDGEIFAFPEATHGDATLESQRAPYLTAWDAIGDLELNNDPSLKLTGKWARLLPSIPEGSNYLHHTDRGHGLPIFGWRRRYWSFLLKLKKSLPSWTIAAQPGPAIGPFHWRNRRLSMLELCRLQTFPHGYEVIGTPRAVQMQLGNAVPSALAECLAKEIAGQFLRSRPQRGQLTLLPKRRTPMPREYPAKDVPAEFQPLVGIHSPHPGTGQGYGAARRKHAEKREQGTASEPT